MLDGGHGDRMGVSDLHSEKNTGAVLDLSARGLQKLDPTFSCSEDTYTVILDGNHIMKLDHLEKNPWLQQLSVASNRLVRMMGVSQLTQLRVLNLPNNSIGYIEGLRDLQNLEWLNLSGNNIKVIEQLNNCVTLQHLDLSDNNISSIGDLSKLVTLKTLLLHGNSITTLRTVPAHLPASLSILSLAENEIRDLNEVLYLASLHNLEQMSIMSNPCVMATPSLPGFDYRPYIMSWSLNLKVLDGYIVSQKEALKAEWLYSQGKGRSYRPGQHVQLVQYLATVCPLTSSPALETAEDAKLEKILSKQRLHQRQLLEESRGGCHSPPRPTQLDVSSHSPPSVALEEDASEVKRTSSPAQEPIRQVNTWVGNDSPHTPLSTVCNQRQVEEHIFLEDVQTDEDKLSSSMLSSESTFLPFASDMTPQIVNSDSEDETETFEPDSLAPEWPTKPKESSKSQVHKSPTLAKQTNGVETVVSGALTTSATPEVDATAPHNHLTNSDSAKAKVEHATKEGQVYISKLNPTEANKAAVKIQSWWRGQHTRRCHPVAREVRSEIRLRRMQDHILFLTEKCDRLQQHYEEERLQRLVQEEAVKFLWTQLQSMQQWKQSVEEKLASVTQAVTPAQSSEPGPCVSSPLIPVATTNPRCTDVSFPDSGFQSTCGQQGAPEDSFLSSGTTDSLKTVRTLSPAQSDAVDSEDCSLLEKYLSSVQQREEEEDVVSDRTETPQPSSPASPGQSTPTNSPAQRPPHQIR